jgi:23S rRNA (guanosine2251-2'-O)-methyltransferase
MVADAAADRQLAPLLEQAVAAGISIQKVTRRELDQQVPGGRHQGVLAVVREVTKGISEKQMPDFLAALTEPAFLLVLDGVQDPHNLGACLRTADAAGVHAVIVAARPRRGDYAGGTQGGLRCGRVHADFYGDQPGAHPAATA